MDSANRHTVRGSGCVSYAPAEWRASLGRRGEDFAVQYLESQGYIILERNWKSGHKDIDIIARWGGTLVFVEVKTRSSKTFGEPEEAVGYRKMKNIVTSASAYMSETGLWLEPRYDIISILGTSESDFKLSHISGAFQAGDVLTNIRTGRIWNRY